MKTFFILFATAIMLSTVSCELNDESKLQEFKAIAPDDWDCEIIESGFTTNDILSYAPTPYAAVKYTNYNLSYTTNLGEIHPEFLLNLYQIKERKFLLDTLETFMIFSSCVPRYYGETKDFFITCSTCSYNYVGPTDSVSTSFDQLKKALDDIVEKKEYDQL